MSETILNIDVNNCTKDDLIEFLRGEGLKPAAGMSKTELQVLVSKQTGQRIDAGSIPDESQTLVSVNHQELRKQRKVKIRIAEQKEYPKRIFVSCNGIDFTIKPGAIVEVPESIVKVLRDARQTFIEQIEENGKLRNITHENVQYQFEVLS